MILLRADKGSELTHEEVDSNFSNLAENIGTQTTNITNNTSEISAVSNTLNNLIVTVDENAEGNSEPLPSFVKDIRILETGYNMGSSKNVEIYLGFGPGDLEFKNVDRPIGTMHISGNIHVNKNLEGMHDFDESHGIYTTLGVYLNDESPNEVEYVPGATYFSFFDESGTVNNYIREENGEFIIDCSGYMEEPSVSYETTYTADINMTVYSFASDEEDNTLGDIIDPSIMLVDRPG